MLVDGEGAGVEETDKESDLAGTTCGWKLSSVGLCVRGGEVRVVVSAPRSLPESGDGAVATLDAID